MSQDIIIYPSGDTSNSNPFIIFSGGNTDYIIEMTPDGFLDISMDEHIVSYGLVMNLDAGNLNSYSGGTTLYDLSGEGNNATLVNGPVVVPNQNGGVVQVDGSNDYISVSNMPTGNTWSIMMWTLIDGPTVFNVAGHRTYASTDNFRFQWDDKGVNNAYAPFVDFVSPNGGAVGFFSKPETDIFNKWNMVTMTCDGTTVRQYWNDDISPTTTTARNFSSNGNMQIGYNGLSGIGGTDIFNRDGGDCYFGNVMVYNRGLTEAEVLQNYNEQKDRFTL